MIRTLSGTYHLTFPILLHNWENQPGPGTVNHLRVDVRGGRLIPTHYPKPDTKKNPLGFSDYILESVG